MGDKWTEDAKSAQWGRNWDKDAPNIETDTKVRVWCLLGRWK